MKSVSALTVILLLKVRVITAEIKTKSPRIPPIPQILKEILDHVPGTPVRYEGG